MALLYFWWIPGLNVETVVSVAGSAQTEMRSFVFVSLDEMVSLGICETDLKL